jgi:hypothetical protein
MMTNYIKYEVKVYTSGTQYWYLNGKLHREDGPAIEYANGNKYWYLNGKLHREDGPAIEWVDGTKSWYLNDELHREDGPAIEGACGTKSWYLNGEYLTEEEHRVRMYPVVETPKTKELFTIVEIKENTHDGSAILTVDIEPEMVQMVLEKGLTAMIIDGLEGLIEESSDEWTA